MARALSPEKRQLLLEAAVRQIAEKGLAASTAGIAKGAGLAEGTMFTYFSSKDELLNELYVTLKTEAFGRIQAGFPQGAALRERARHVWTEYLRWATEKPRERKVSMLLHLSTSISSTSRKQVHAERGAVSQTMRELGRQGAFKNLPSGFAASAMSSMQEAVMETTVKGKKEREKLFDQAFEAFWRMAK